jgi:2-dehydro-3-deoxygluconokinase
MPDLHVISLGEAMLRLTPPTGVRLEVATGYELFVAGAESNTLAALARLGVRTTFLSALPSTPPGRLVEGELRKHGVGTSRVLWSEGRRLGVFYAEEGPAPRGPSVYYDRSGSAFALLDPANLDLHGLESADLVHLTGITPALSTGARNAFARMLEFATSNHIPLSFDVNYRAKLWLPAEAAASIADACSQARVLFCTMADAATLWGLSGGPEAVLEGLADRFGGEGKTLVLTLGGEGSAQMRDGAFHREAAFDAEGPHRFGSGDAFDAGYLYAHLDGDHYRKLPKFRPN